MLFGLLAKTPEGAGAFSYILLLLIFISPSFVPTDSMTPLLRGFAENQPMTPIIETMRSLLTEGTAGPRHLGRRSHGPRASWSSPTRSRCASIAAAHLSRQPSDLADRARGVESSRPLRGGEAGEVHLAEHEEQLGRPS